MDREHRDWYRLFGLILTDFFQGSPFRVELEKDVAEGTTARCRNPAPRQGCLPDRLPDGLEGPAAHNGHWWERILKNSHRRGAFAVFHPQERPPWKNLNNALQSPTPR
jgi:hypothetical protein